MGSSILEHLRKEIDLIHQELFKLFMNRIVLTEKIWDIKKNENFPLDDFSRENQLITMHDSNPLFDRNEALKEAYHTFVKELILVNKAYLHTIKSQKKKLENE